MAVLKKETLDIREVRLYVSCKILSSAVPKVLYTDTTQVNFPPGLFNELLPLGKIKMILYEPHASTDLQLPQRVPPRLTENCE